MEIDLASPTAESAGVWNGKQHICRMVRGVPCLWHVSGSLGPGPRVDYRSAFEPAITQVLLNPRGF